MYSLDPEPYYSLVFSLNIFGYPEDTSHWLGIILLILLLLCSALISGAEVALFSLSQTDINKALEEKSKAIKKMARF